MPNNSVAKLGFFVNVQMTIFLVKKHQIFDNFFSFFENRRILSLVRYSYLLGKFC